MPTSLPTVSPFSVLDLIASEIAEMDAAAAIEDLAALVRARRAAGEDVSALVAVLKVYHGATRAA